MRQRSAKISCLVTSPEARNKAAASKVELAEQAMANNDMTQAKLLIAEAEDLTSKPNDAAGDDEVISFDPHQSSWMLQSQISQLAAALVVKACPENQSLLRDMKPPEAEPWPVQQKYAVYIVHDEQTPLVIEQAEAIKKWLVTNTDLNESQVVLQVDTR